MAKGAVWLAWRSCTPLQWNGWELSKTLKILEGGCGMVVMYVCIYVCVWCLKMCMYYWVKETCSHMILSYADLELSSGSRLPDCVFFEGCEWAVLGRR